MEEGKNILFGEDARSRLLAGLKFGHDALFQMTTDESDLSQKLESADPFLDSGLSFMREAAKKMIRECGEGAIFVSLLLYKMAEESLKYSPIGLIEDLESTSNLILDSLEKATPPIQLVRDDGLHIDSDSMTEELDDARVLIIDKSITSPHDLLPLLQEIQSSNHPLLIIANNIDGDTLSTLTINKLQGRMNVYVIKAPGSKERQAQFLQEVARATNGTIVSKDARIADLGNSKKIFIGKKSKNEHTLFAFSLNTTDDPASKIINSAYKWAIQFSPPISSPEVISYALKYALPATISILLSEALIVESHF